MHTLAVVAQNIYDDPVFFGGYSGLPRSVLGLDAAPEWPTLRDLVGNVAGRAVVDLGCGFGWFCRWAAGAGAAHVLGIDLSSNMLARATADTVDSRVTFAQQDLDALQLPGHAFDVAYSSLTLHYLLDLDALFRRVRDALRPSGSFVFSVEHPIYTAPAHPGFRTTEAGRSTWPVDSYLLEGPRTTDWLAPGVVKQHRTIATYVSALRRNGFVLTDLVEWGPSPAQIDETPDWALEVERPAFLLMAAQRP